MKQVFNINLESDRFWLMIEGEDGCYEELPDWNAIDKIAKGFKWSMKSIEPGQRKFRNSSCMTNSILAMLSIVKVKLVTASEVVCLTPDVEIHFFKG